MDGKKIRLWQRVFDFKNLGKIINRAMGTFQCKAGLLPKALRRIDTDWDTPALIFPLRHCLDVVKIANCPGKKLQNISIS